MVLGLGLVLLALGASGAENKAAVTGNLQTAENSGDVPPRDTTPPEIQCPGDVAFECDSIGDFGTPTVHDDFDPEPVVTYQDHVTYFNCPFEYTMIRTWTATDASGNSSACDQTITIDDSIPPVLICPNDTAVACDQWNDAGWPYLHDNCNPSPHLDYEPVVVVDYERYHNKVIRTWEATDSCCNKIGCQQIVTLLDTIPPLVACGANDTIPCDWPVEFPEPRVEDNCAAQQEIIVEVASLDTVPGPEGCEYTVTKCWIARDNFGNVSEPCCQSISVADCADQMCTFTIGGWGSPCPGSQEGDPESTQPGCIRDYYFDSVFPDGVMIGDTSGADTYGAVWTAAGAVELFLPGGGGAGMLDADLVDPLATPAGILASQLLALRLNREYSCAGVFAGLGLAPAGACYGDFVIPEACGSFGGLTVDQFLTLADRAISGQIDVLEPYGDSLAGLNGTATCLNELYDACEEASLAALAALGLWPQDPQSTETDTSADKGSTVLSATAGPRWMAGSITYPNPLKTSAAIELEVGSAGMITVEVFDVRGLKVRTLISANRPAGRHTVIWDGTDSKGDPVACGVYFCRIQAPGGQALLEKLVKME